MACRHYNKYSSELLIQYGADVHLRDKLGESATSIIEKNKFNYIIGLD